MSLCVYFTLLLFFVCKLQTNPASLPKLRQSIAPLKKRLYHVQNFGTPRTEPFSNKMTQLMTKQWRKQTSYLVTDGEKGGSASQELCHCL